MVTKRIPRTTFAEDAGYARSLQTGTELEKADGRDVIYGRERG